MSAEERTVRLEALRRRVLDDPEVPGLVRTFLERGAKLDDVRLDARGRWWHEHGPVENDRVARLFAMSLQRTKRGTWILEVPPYTYPVSVEDCGWFVDRFPLAHDAGAGHLTDGSEVDLRRATWVTDAETFFGVRLVDGRLARFVGAAHENVLSRCDVDGDTIVIDVDGTRIPFVRRGELG